MSKLEVNTIEPQCGTNVTLGANNDTISLGTGAVFSGGLDAVKWETTPQTGSFGALSGRGYFINSGSALTVSLPAGSAGAIVAFSDYARNFATYNLTISPNGSEKIGGVAADAKLTVDGQAATFVYVDSTKGWINVQNAEDTEAGAGFIEATGGTVTTVNCGACKVHTFTGPGTFCVSAAGIPANNVVSYMVVAGGGGGGVKRAGGGGAGGFREYKSPVTPYTASPLNGNPGGTEITVTAQGYPITVGGGGSAGTGGTPICACASPANTQGSTSTFSTVSSAGGGAGGGTGTPTGAGGSGGSGGGGVHAMTGRPSPAANAAGSGNTPPVSPAQGTNGGVACQPEPAGQGGGGGGATQAGSAGGDGQSAPAGDGGGGATTNITGSPVSYAGGGGGGARPNGRQGSGGTGGGGPGANEAPKPNGDPVNNGTAGTANTGGGGGASADVNGALSGAGGSGIVIIRYKNA